MANGRPTLISLCGMFLLFFGCGKSDEQSRPVTPPASEEIPLHWQSGDASCVHFFEETELAIGRGEYLTASRHLQKGIIAYRKETGRLAGSRARHSNRSIDSLVRLNKRLRSGQQVAFEEFHQTVLNALDVDGVAAPPLKPKPGRDLGVPVGGQ